ncbi:MAG: alanine--tRNA ligase, partial [Pseudomonadota bacterium]|nr:alanine--tRNA ligase [Pseudomonadota bacterium]
RIMRRAMRHGSLLGANDPLMYRLVPALVREMGAAYPDLKRAEALITETLHLEETRFRKTLERGIGLLEDATRGLSEGDMLDGETAFKLYDTYGFPLDLTQDALRRRGISVNLDGFQDAMARQKAEARASWAGSGDAADEKVWFAIRERTGATEFLGYGTETAEGVVQALVADGAETGRAGEGADIAIIVNQTPFYGESGGQLGDKGEMRFEGGRVEVHDTKKKADGLFVHQGRVVEGTLETGMAVEMEVDHAARAGLRSHHSATHLVHEALREVLGTHVAQKGSLVAPDRLRFDFSHPKPIGEAELAEVELIANEVVRQAAPVETRLMAVDDAIELGAMALFGEKYGDEVRVVSMGTATRGDKAGKTYSLELCGGTHVRNTGEIGLIHIIAEGAVAAGVRRVEALTGKAALAHAEEQEARLREIAAALKVPPADAPARVAALVEERRRLERELADARRKLALGGGGATSGPEAKDVNGISFLAQVAEGVSPKDLKGLVDDAKARIGSGVAMMVATAEDDKAAVVVGVTDDLTGRFNAVDLVRAASQELGGKGGGGRPDMAQAGGPDGANAGKAIAAVEAALQA